MQTKLENHRLESISAEYDLLETEREKLRKRLKNNFLLKFFFLAKLPLALLTGLRVKTLNKETGEVTIPYKYLNKNPFKSTYFAALAMAAEMSTGIMVLIALHKCKPSVSMLVVDLRCKFVKKATTKVTFTCNEGNNIKEAVLKTLDSGESVELIQQTTGRDLDGNVVAEFEITWSFRARKK
ncbi:MAG: DUF4442 domain-containing protein [Chitinophagaceae bacterium]|nr:MAG: DUF4442 domain-containing protein [Chitinophagaceae bacterium]